MKLKSIGHLPFKLPFVSLVLIAMLWTLLQMGMAKEASPIFRVVRDQKVGFIDSGGKVVIPIELSPRTGEYADGIILTATAKQKEVAEKGNGFSVTSAVFEWAALDRNAKELFRLKGYRLVNDFKFGYAMVVNSSGLHGFIDKQGREVVSCRYAGSQRITGWEGGYLVENSDGSKILTDILTYQGKRLSTLTNFYGVVVNEGMATVNRPDGEAYFQHLSGFANQSGEIVVPVKYDYVSDFSEGLAMVGVAQCRPPKPMPTEEEFAKAIESGAGAVIEGHPVLTNYFVTAIDTNAQVVFTNNFKYWRPYSEGLAQVQIGDKWGFIDRKGTIVIQPQFEMASPFSEGLAAVIIEGKCGFINKSGEWVIRPQLTVQAGRLPRIIFKDGLARIYGAKGYGYINKAGEWVWPISE